MKNSNITTKRDWFGITLGFFIPVFLFVFILSTQHYFIKADSIYKTILAKTGYYDKIFNHLKNVCWRVHQGEINHSLYTTDGILDYPRHNFLCSASLLPHDLPGYFVLFLFFCIFSFGFCWYRKLNPFKFIANLFRGFWYKQAENDFLKMVETTDNHKNYFVWGLVIFFIFGVSLFLVIPILALIFSSK